MFVASMRTCAGFSFLPELRRFVGLNSGGSSISKRPVNDPDVGPRGPWAVAESAAFVRVSQVNTPTRSNAQAPNRTMGGLAQTRDGLSILTFISSRGFRLF